MNNLEQRKFIVISSFVVIAIIFLMRLFYIQVIDDSYVSSADNQALRFVTKYPARGIVYDRNGEILVLNQAAYDLMVVPVLVGEVDTTSICSLLEIEKDAFIERMEQARNFSRYRASIFKKQMTSEEYSRVAERLYQFTGFYGQKRSLRIYPDSIAAHVLGYIGEVNQGHLDKDTFYRSGDFVGISGIERQYETALRGHRGREVLMVDVHNTVQGKYEDGALDVEAKAGENLILSLDLQIQKYGEQLMQNKKGSIVAIEPKTGEVLCLISSPTYDPNLLV
ncbi:penicillin-binding protein 2, partial [Salibacteraceae bacterium]|nr:penicillin-binding protein 2 [Salibacteraceae bacterium]